MTTKLFRLTAVLAALFAAAAYAPSLRAAMPIAHDQLAASADRSQAPAPVLKSPAPAVSRAADPRPVIITVPGLLFGEIGWGPLELKHFIKLLHILFPKKAMYEKELAPAFAEYNAQFDSMQDLAASEPASGLRLPDNYLEAKVQEAPEFAASGATLIPFPWSRDPGDTEKVVPVFEAKLAAVYDQYKGTGRPIYILAHSWGSVLMHETLHRLEKSRPDVRINKLITLGSPLIPGNPVIALFMKVEIFQENLQKAVVKPSNVARWTSLWASRDMYSNAIRAADENVQIDLDVENFESRLWDLFLHDPARRKQARIDLFSFRNVKTWHYSYMYDFTDSLSAINVDFYLPVFKPVTTPRLFNRPQK